ncbi:hypothetical protein [Caviibacter abscessus]|uniref:hypothetical protein n=2 Tax=Caviibacter abscessus TaxID=1766719 RepID=UPI000834B2B0|nr:hypothetical protein [Caviibacter abscessus]
MKLVKMADEVLKFLLEKKGKEININISEKEKVFEISAKSKINISEKEMEYITSNFARHKDLEYDFYWELMGENSDEDELELLFILADDIRIYYENDEFLMIIELKK